MSSSSLTDSRANVYVVSKNDCLHIRCNLCRLKYPGTHLQHLERQYIALDNTVRGLLPPDSTNCEKSLVV